ncbi:MAG TPA: universal stress protein [Solirubrobacteraceae bacterium]|jgi:hypothetical protein|nr:universal stress protein [Solirubrobacteraceae bacterium]
MTEILVVANRTIGGRPVLERVRELAKEPGTRFRLVVPAQRPGSGLVIYDDAVRDAAQVRVDLAVTFLRREGIQVEGEVGDEDPFHATMDAIGERRPDQVIVSTLPATSSGWMRRDLIERIQQATGLPVEHVVVDLSEGLPMQTTLVIANKTSGGHELIDRLKEMAPDPQQHVFILVMPLSDGGGRASWEARGRLATVLDRLRNEGLVAAGMVGDPDPYTAAVNALDLFTVSSVVISTLPEEKSGWTRARLVERVRSASRVPVEHVVVPIDDQVTA